MRFLLFEFSCKHRLRNTFSPVINHSLPYAEIFWRNCPVQNVSGPVIGWHFLYWGAIFNAAQCVNKLFEMVLSYGILVTIFVLLSLLHRFRYLTWRQLTGVQFTGCLWCESKNISSKYVYFYCLLLILIYYC